MVAPRRCWASCGNAAGGCWCSITQQPEDVTEWLPGGGGHVLITSRAAGGQIVAVPVEVDVLARPESVAILRDRVPGWPRRTPTCLPQSWGTCRWRSPRLPGTCPAPACPRQSTWSCCGPGRRRSWTGQADVLPGSLAAATQLTFDQLADEDPAAAQLASAVCVPGPRADPEDVFTAAAGELPEPLATRRRTRWRGGRLLGQLTNRSLARVDQQGLQLHRLTQAILRDRLTPDQAAATRARAEAILVAYDPGTPGSHRLAGVGAADAAPAGRRPRCHQSRPPQPGDRRGLVPADARRHRLRS